MAIEALEGVTDQELFNDANADEPAVEPAEEPAEPVEPDQPRDDAGRFAAPAAEEPAPVATDPPASPPVDDNAAMVPSWRVREINEEKRATAERLVAAEAELARLRQAPPVQPAPQPQAPPVR